MTTAFRGRTARPERRLRITSYRWSRAEWRRSRRNEVAGGGESGIRTHGTLLTYTRFPSVRLKPLGHLSGVDPRSCQACGTGGEGGIRTPDTRKGITVFETAAFNHSATSPFHDSARATAGKTTGATPSSAPPSVLSRPPIDD